MKSSGCTSLLLGVIDKNGRRIRSIIVQRGKKPIEILPTPSASEDIFLDGLDQERRELVS